MPFYKDNIASFERIPSNGVSSCSPGKMSLGLTTFNAKTFTASYSRA